ncbi:hypothetical protein BHE74_00037727 [Ensete ventricosum]|nr:hypothetical protein BHE74_00037727 [Ensete ventricosum]
MRRKHVSRTRINFRPISFPPCVSVSHSCPPPSNIWSPRLPALPLVQPAIHVRSPPWSTHTAKESHFSSSSSSPLRRLYVPGSSSSRRREERVIRPMEAGLVLNILPRGSTPPSSPSKGGNGVGGTARINTERMLGSVPSPGIGH